VHTALTFFNELLQRFEDSLKFQLNPDRQGDKISEAFDYLARLEQTRSDLEKAFHRLAGATRFSLARTAAFEQSTEMAQRLQEICDMRFGVVGTRLRTDELIDFYTDAFLGLCWAYIQPKQDEYDKWLAERRNRPFFNLDLEPIEMG
jgi:hypothetical protein